MMKKLTIGILTCLALVGCAKTSTPESTIQGFLESAQSGKVSSIVEYLDPAKQDSYETMSKEEILDLAVAMGSEINENNLNQLGYDIDLVAYGDEETAQVKIIIDEYNSWFDLENIDGTWYIVEHK